MSPDSSTDQDITNKTEMFPAVKLFKVVVLVLTVAPGTVLNSMIIRVYYGDGRKGRRSSTCDHIFLSMALTNLSQQWCHVLASLLHYVLVDLPYAGWSLFYVCIFSLVLSCFHFWNTAWLSSYYCIKLVNCSDSHLIWLKDKLSSSMTQIIGISLLGIFIINLPLFWVTALRVVPNITSGYMRYSFHIDALYATPNLLLGCIFPFVETLICIGLSVTSLLRHVRRIKMSSSEFTWSPEVHGHIRAVTVMILQTFLNATLNLAISGLVMTSYKPIPILDGLFGLIIMINPSAQAFTLITGNPKLKSRLLRRVNIF